MGVHNEEFTISDLWIDIKDGLPKSTRDELDDHPEDYRSLTYEYWCDLLPTIKGKDENKSAAAQTKNIDSARAAYLSGVEYSSKIQRKNKSRTGILWSNKTHKKAHKNHSIQRYCVLCKKLGMPERNYISHSAKDCTGMRTNRNIKDGMK